MKEVALKGGIDNNDSRRIDLDRKELGLGALVGYQFRISCFAIGLYTGTGTMYRMQTESLVDGGNEY